MVHWTRGEIIAIDGGVGMKERGRVGKDDGFETVFLLKEGK